MGVLSLCHDIRSGEAFILLSYDTDPLQFDEQAFEGCTPGKDGRACAVG